MLSAGTALAGLCYCPAGELSRTSLGLFCLSLPVRSLIGGAHDGLEYRRALVAELLPKRKSTILTGVPVKLGFTFASECDSKHSGRCHG